MGNSKSGEQLDTKYWKHILSL